MIIKSYGRTGMLVSHVLTRCAHTHTNNTHTTAECGNKDQTQTVNPASQTVAGSSELGEVVSGQTGADRCRKGPSWTSCSSNSIQAAETQQILRALSLEVGVVTLAESADQERACVQVETHMKTVVTST